MKVTVLKFSPELLAELLRADASLNASLPKNVELVDLKLDLASNEVSAVFRASDKDVETVRKEVTHCQSLGKIGQCAMLENLKKRLDPQHRKLLAFDVESGILHARPIQHLGVGEWDEINDFVKKLGGSWVNDGMDGYWKIFLL
jgi:hypothetical protein